MKKAISLWMFLLVELSLSARESYTFLNMGLRQGLSNEFVCDMVMDAQGFLWVATESGLTRIAGNKCTVFKTSNSDISDDGFIGLYYDKGSHSVWMHLGNGKIDIFDCRTQSFSHFSQQEGQLPEGVSSIGGASDGGIWIAYVTGTIQHYDIRTRRFTTYPNHLFPHIKNGVRCICDDGNEQLFIGLRSEGMYIYNLRTGKARYFCHRPDDATSLPGDNVRSICIDHLQNIWVGTNLGLALMDLSTGRFRVFQPQPDNPHSLAGNNIHQIVEMDNHTLWIASDIGGISVLDLNHYQHPYTEPLSFRQITQTNSGLSSDEPQRIIQDSFGNIWIGHYSSGIDFIPNSPSEFLTLSYLPQPLRPVSNIYFDPQGCLWLGEDTRLCQYKEGELVGSWDFSRHLFNTSALIYDIIADRQGHIWLGTSDNGVLEFNPHTRQFTPYHHIQGLDVHALWAGRDGQVWIGGQDGLYTVSQGIEQEETEMNRLMGNSHSNIFTIREDTCGQLWIGCLTKGVFVFNQQKRLVAHLDDSNGLRSNSVNHIAVDANNGIWIATYQGLAYIENPLEPHDIQLYDERQGLKDIHIRAVCPDKLGNIWVSLYSGISCFDVQRQRFYNYDFQSGIPMGNFIESSAAMTPDGTLYFVSPGGVCYFHPQLLSSQKQVSPVEIIGCERVGRLSDEILRTLISPDAKGVVHLEHDDNTFKISFTIKDFSQEGHVEYSYMMSGLDDPWFETEGDKDVTFRNLKPGHYTFTIRAKLKNQEWSEASSASLKVVVHPPLWLTWWAKLGYLLLVSGVMAYLLRSYKKQLVLRNSLAQAQWESQQKQEVNEERLRFFTNITHELRTPLTLILGPLEDLVEDGRLPEFARQKIGRIQTSAERLLNLINDILEFRKAETQNRRLTVARANLGALVRETGMRFKDLNHNPRLQIEMDIEEEIPEIYFDSEVITTVVNNLMSNAIKYTPSGHITLSLALSPTGQVALSVADTGYGIDPEALPHICDRYYQENGKHQASGTGIGLALVKSLARLHEAELTVESEKGKGSRFSFILQRDYTYPEALHKDDEQPAPKDAAPAASADQASDTPAEESMENQRPLLLIVEDNSDIRQYIEESLQEDYRILSSCHGREGLDLAFRQIPDLILSDIMMPEMDGIEMTRMLKADIRTSHIPIILLTAKTGVNDQQEGYDSGADSYLMKPFSTRLLQSRIRNILSSRRRLAEYLVQQNFPTGSSSSEADTPQAPPAAGMPEAPLNELDRKFLDKLNSLIETHVSTDDLDMAFMTDQMAMSHSTFYRKVKALTGLSAKAYIKKAKLRKSLLLLQTKQYSVVEVALMTGFINQGNFRESFKQEFGITPSDVLKS